MAVDLPRNVGKLVCLLNAPLADRRIGFAKTRVGAKMDVCCHASCRQLRALDAIVAGKPLADLRSYLDRPLAIAYIQSHMTPWFWKASGANKRPDLAAGCWDKLRQL